VRLFAAIRPPECVLESLEAELDRVRGPARFDRALRWTARELWHLTLAFYGDDDLESRSSWLRERVAGHGPLTLSLAGAGTFRGVLWGGVSEDVDELTALAEDVGGGGGRRYHPHVTLANRGKLSQQSLGFSDRAARVATAVDFARQLEQDAHRLRGVEVVIHSRDEALAICGGVQGIAAGGQHHVADVNVEVDFVQHARSMGALGEWVQGIGELGAAFERQAFHKAPARAVPGGLQPQRQDRVRQPAPHPRSLVRGKLGGRAEFRGRIDHGLDPGGLVQPGDQNRFAGGDHGHVSEAVKRDHRAFGPGEARRLMRHHGPGGVHVSAVRAQGVQRAMIAQIAPAHVHRRDRDARDARRLSLPAGWD
jgi:2'-5' RNA ligase